MILSSNHVIIMKIWFKPKFSLYKFTDILLRNDHSFQTKMHFLPSKSFDWIQLHKIFTLTILFKNLPIVHKKGNTIRNFWLDPTSKHFFILTIFYNAIFRIDPSHFLPPGFLQFWLQFTNLSLHHFDCSTCQESWPSSGLSQIHNFFWFTNSTLQYFISQIHQFTNSPIHQLNSPILLASFKFVSKVSISISLFMFFDSQWRAPYQRLFWFECH